MLKGLFKKLIYKEDATSDSLIDFLRNKGAVIGENVIVYAPNKTLIDKTKPFLLSIGNNVRITQGVKILTHDYSWSVIKCYSSHKCDPGQIIGSEGPVTVGNNVFIGMNAIITKGVTVGDNVIIGAGSIVTKDCESDSVYAGNPAKKIMSIDEFFAKRKALQFEEAKLIAQKYKERFNKLPGPEVFMEYFYLFSTGKSACKNEIFKYQMETSGNFDESYSFLENNPPMFPDFESFINACFKD